MDSMDDILGTELQALQDRVSELESENSSLKKIIVDNDLEDEIEDIDCTSVEEQICVNGIMHIASLIKDQSYDKDDVKNFDTLYKALRVIRGQTVPKDTNKKKLNIQDALKIVQGK